MHLFFNDPLFRTVTIVLLSVQGVWRLMLDTAGFQVSTVAERARKSRGPRKRKVARHRIFNAAAENESAFLRECNRAREAVFPETGKRGGGNKNKAAKTVHCLNFLALPGRPPLREKENTPREAFLRSFIPSTQRPRRHADMFRFVPCLKPTTT